MKRSKQFIQGWEWANVALNVEKLSQAEIQDFIDSSLDRNDFDLGAERFLKGHNERFGVIP